MCGILLVISKKGKLNRDNCLVSDIVERNNYNIEPNSVGRHGKVFNEREVS